MVPHCSGTLTATLPAFMTGRMGFRGTVLLLLGMVATGPTWAVSRADVQLQSSLPESFFSEYIQTVLSGAHAYYGDWTETLLETEWGTERLSLSLHRIGIETDDPFPMWKSHLSVVQSLAASARRDMNLDQQVGFRFYLWTEREFLPFEQVLLSRLESETADFDSCVEEQHARRRPPTHYETDELMTHYLNAFVLAALLHTENERYLSVFPFRGSHPETLRSRQGERVGLIDDCRVALVRMFNPRYKWELR